LHHGQQWCHDKSLLSGRGRNAIDSSTTKAMINVDDTHLLVLFRQQRLGMKIVGGIESP
jgi:hypothetical protein